MAVSVVDIQVNSQNAVRNLQQVNGASKAAATGVNTLRNAVTGLVAGFSAIQAAKFVFVKTAELETQTRSIQTLTGSVQEAKRIISELQAIGAVTPFTSTELIDTAKRLSAFGVAANQVVDTTRRLGDVAGATGANLGELSLAYGQVIAKGRLQGEELLQFQERGVALQDELRKMYGLTGEEFSKALSKGQVSAQAVEVALQRLTDVGGKYANGAIAQSDTLSGRFSTLQDGVESLARTVGSALTPAIKGVLNEAIFALNTINQLIATGARAKSFGMDQGQRQQILKQAQGEAESIVNMRRIKDPFERNRQFQQLAGQRERDLIEAYGFSTGQVKPAVTVPTTPRGVPPLGGGTAGGGGGGAKGGADKAANDAKRLAEETKRQLEAADDLNFALKNQLAILEETDAVKKRAIQYDVRLNEINKESTELKKQSKSNDELILINANEIVNRRIAQIEYEREINDLLAERARLMFDVVKAAGMPTVYNELETQKAALDELLQKYPAIGAAADAASTLATSGIQQMIDGTQSAQQVFASFLQSIADALIDTAKQMIAQYIAIGIARMFAGLGGGPGGFAPSGTLPAVGNVGTGFNFDAAAMLPARAMGGSVSSGQSYLVGERGPELFTPGRSGGIAPTGSFGGGMNVTVNVDASGSNVQGDQQQGAALGRAIAAAVQSELVKQKRPGGILA